MYQDPSELMVMKKNGHDGTVRADRNLSPYNLKLPLALQATVTVGLTQFGDEAGMTHAWLRFDRGLAKKGTEEKRCFALNLFLNLFGFKALTPHGVGDGPHGSVLAALSPPPGISLPLMPTLDVEGKPTKEATRSVDAMQSAVLAGEGTEFMNAIVATENDAGFAAALADTTQTQAPAVSKGAALPASSSMEQPLAQSLPQAAEEPQQERGLPLAPVPLADAPSTSDVPEELPALSLSPPTPLPLKLCH